MRQYIIVNESLDMSPGKVAAQVAHATTGYAVNIGINGTFNSFTEFLLWFERHKQRKVVVKMSGHDLKYLPEMLIGLGIPFYAVYDTGANEVPAGSLTAIAIGPQHRELLPKWFAKLRLL